MSEHLPNDPDRDTALTALYRAGADDEPPRGLDDAIRAAARRALASKPRLAGAPFSGSWGVPLSIAAVVVVSVSLVTLMREQAPEITQAPRTSYPEQSADSAPGARERIPASPKPLSDVESSGLGLKPPQPSSGLGIRGNADSGASFKLRQQTTIPDRNESGRSAPPAREAAAPDPFPGAGAVRDAKIAAPAPPPRSAGGIEQRRNLAASAELQQPSLAREAPADVPTPLKAESDAGPRAPQASVAATAPPANAPAEAKAQARRESGGYSGFMQSPGARVQSTPEPAPPAAKAAARPRADTASSVAAVPQAAEKTATPTAETIRGYASLPPDQWLARIEELRKQGRLEEARASLTEFRKRHGDYPLPASLKDGIQR